MSREIETIETKEDFIYLADRNQLPQEWVDANGGPDGVGEVLRGERKVKKPRGSRRSAEATSEASSEEVEEADEDEDAEGKK